MCNTTVTYVGRFPCTCQCHGGVNGSFHDARGWPVFDPTRFTSVDAMTAKAHDGGLKPGFYVNNYICGEGMPPGGTAGEAYLTVMKGKCFFCSALCNRLLLCSSLDELSNARADRGRRLLFEKTIVLSCGCSWRGTSNNMLRRPIVANTRFTSNVNAVTAVSPMAHTRSHDNDTHYPGTVDFLKETGFQYLKIDSGSVYNDLDLWHRLVMESGADITIENCHQGEWVFARPHTHRKLATVIVATVGIITTAIKGGGSSRDHPPTAPAIATTITATTITPQPQVLVDINNVIHKHHRHRH